MRLSDNVVWVWTQPGHWVWQGVASSERPGLYEQQQGGPLAPLAGSRHRVSEWMSGPVLSVPAHVCTRKWWAGPHNPITTTHNLFRCDNWIGKVNSDNSIVEPSHTYSIEGCGGRLCGHWALGPATVTAANPPPNTRHKTMKFNLPIHQLLVCISPACQLMRLQLVLASAVLICYFDAAAAIVLTWQLQIKLHSHTPAF